MPTKKKAEPKGSGKQKKPVGEPSVAVAVAEPAEPAPAESKPTNARPKYDSWEEMARAKYRPAYCQQVKAYFRVNDPDNPPWGAGLPNMAKWAHQLKDKNRDPRPASMRAVHLWRQEHPEFAEAYEIAVDSITAYLMDKGAQGQLDSTLIKFILQSMYGMATTEQKKAEDPNAGREITYHIQVDDKAT